MKEKKYWKYTQFSLNHDYGRKVINHLGGGFKDVFFWNTEILANDLCTIDVR